MVMWSGQKGWIGVDVGTRTIKLAQVERVRQGLRLVDAKVVQRHTPWTDGGEELPTSPEPSHEEIGAALALGEGFVGRTSACVLPMGVHDVRAMHIPSGSESDRRAMIASELDAIFESESQSREFGFWEINIPKTAGKQDLENVGVLSLPRPWAAQAAIDFSRTRLNCQLLDGLPLALARAVQMTTSPMAAGAPIAAVDLGFSSTTFCIVQDGRPQYTRRVPGCSLGQMIKSVRTTLDVTLDEAQYLLATQGLPDLQNPGGQDEDLRAVIAEAASDALNELVEQLGKTLAYFGAHRPSLSPDRIWLFGGGTTVRGVTPYLARAIPVPVDVWQLPRVRGSKNVDAGCPTSMLATAIALSALAWMDS